MHFPHLISSSYHEFNTLSRATFLAELLTRVAPHRSMALLGLSEIFINALEHGNINIDYILKKNLNNENLCLMELNKRLEQRANIHKYISVDTQITPHAIRYHVRDQGAGFDWQKYQKTETVPLTDRHGRGILIAKEIAFDQLIYYPPGNAVDCIIYL